MDEEKNPSVEGPDPKPPHVWLKDLGSVLTIRQVGSRELP